MFPTQREHADGETDASNGRRAATASAFKGLAKIRTPHGQRSGGPGLALTWSLAGPAGAGAAGPGCWAAWRRRRPRALLPFRSHDLHMPETVRLFNGCGGVLLLASPSAPCKLPAASTCWSGLGAGVRARWGRSPAAVAVRGSSRNDRLRRADASSQAPCHQYPDGVPAYLLRFVSRIHAALVPLTSVIAAGRGPDPPCAVPHAGGDLPLTLFGVAARRRFLWGSEPLIMRAWWGRRLISPR